MREVLKLLKKHKPKTAEEFKSKIKYPLKKLGSGAFRTTYHIKGTNLVIKFPYVDDTYCDGDYNDSCENIEHTQEEITNIRNINKKAKYKALRPFMPKIHYTDFRHGIIVMEKYKPARYGKISKLWGSFINTIIDAIEETRDTWSDLHACNLGIDELGNYKIIDLGIYCNEW